jgi:RNA polymerase sigma-70 factor, ECF subfamily
MHGESDEKLLERARAGDARALAALVEQYQASVYRFGMKMCGNPEDAKDVLQDTLLAMARGVREFRGASSIATWLYAIARSYCLKKRRKSTFAPAVERSLDTEPTLETAELASPAKGPDEAVFGRQVERALEQAIAALEPGNREVLILRDVEGLSALQVAEVLGLGVAAVKSRLHRARLEVRAALAPLLDAPGEPQQPAPAACPDVLNLFSQHLEDEVSAEVCAVMEKHLEGCSRCRSACDSLKRALALCKTSGTAIEVPPSVQATVKHALRDFLAAKPSPA